MRPAALLALFLAGCGCAPLADGKRLFNEGKYEEARAALEEAVTTCGLDDDQLPQPLALKAACEIELGRRAEAEASLARAAAVITSLPPGAAPEGDVVLVALAMGAFHESEGKLAFDNIVSARPELSRLALDSYDDAVESYATIVRGAQDPALRRLGAYRWARALLMKARIHEIRAPGELDVAKACVTQALLAVREARADPGPLHTDFADLETQLNNELRLIQGRP